MKLSTSLLIAALASGTLCAQVAPKTVQDVKKAVSTPATTHQAAPAMAHQSSPTMAKPAAAPAKPAMKPAEHPAKMPAPVHKKEVAKKAVAKANPVMKPEAKPEEPKPEEPKAEEPKGEVKPASAKEATVSRVSGAAGRRDPFVSPIVRATGGQGPACETGKRCLVVDQIMLKGIVKSPNGYIAVVENPTKRAYFLRENDPVFNGSVVRITGDSVIFREMTTDKLGKQSTREVVKKVNAPVV